MKKQISERALLARLNRKLEKHSEIIKKCRSDSHAYGDFGNYYSVSLQTNAIQAQHIDLEKWGREYEVLKEWEELED